MPILLKILKTGHKGHSRIITASVMELCAKKIAMELLGFSENDFKYGRIANLDDDIISTLF